MRDLIVGCSTNYTWDTIKYWVNSVNKCGFDGHKVMIMMNCDKDTCKKVIDSGFDIIGFSQNENGDLVHNSPIPVHVERFFHIYNLLRKEEYRYVVTTDVKDVIFQRNPIDFVHNQLYYDKLIFSSESIRYKNEPWGNQNLFETFGEFIYNIDKDNEIYNVGVLAGKGFAMRDLAIMIFQMSINRPIPIVDQSTFNFMVSRSPYKETSLYTTSESGWACQLGTTADPSKIDSFRPFLLEPSPIFEDGLVKTSNGVPYHIVHQYDRTPWRKDIEAKYS